MLKRTISTFLIFIVIMLFGIQCEKQEVIVARVGQETITLDQFEETFSKGRTGFMVKDADLEKMKEHLNKMIEVRLMVQAAHKLGLDKNESVQEKMKPFQKRILNMELYQIEILNRTIKESHIRDFYNRSRKNVVIHDLLFSVPEGAPEDEDEDARNLANQARDRLLKGENSFAVAQDLIKDEKFNKRSGIVRDLKWSTSKDPIRQVAWSMDVGDISNVIRNFRGYHVMKIEKINEDNERIPYEDDRERIRRILTDENKDLLDQRVAAYFTNLEKKHGFQWNEDGLRFLNERILTSGDDSSQKPYDRLMEMSEEEKGTVLLEHPDGQVIIKDVLEKLKGIPASAIYKIASIEYLKGQIRYPFIGDWLLEMAFKKGLHKKKDIAEKLETNLETNLIQFLNDEVVVGQIDITDSVLQAYYEENKETKYTYAAKVKLQEVKVQERELAQKIYNWIQAGRSMDQLVEEYSIRAAFKQRKGIFEISENTRETWGVLGETAFSMNVGDVAGPIDLEKDDGYSVIKLLERTERKIRPFENIKKIVENDYRTSIQDERREKWLEEQRKNVNIQIFEENLAGAFKTTE